MREYMCHLLFRPCALKPLSSAGYLCYGTVYAHPVGDKCGVAFALTTARIQHLAPCLVCAPTAAQGFVTAHATHWCPHVPAAQADVVRAADRVPHAEHADCGANLDPDPG
jgi:hypothetical protein